MKRHSKKLRTTPQKLLSLLMVCLTSNSTNTPVLDSTFPGVNGIASLAPERIGFRKAGLITAGFALVIGGFWTGFISNFGIDGFVNTLGATLAPLFGIMIVDYYVHRRQHLDLNDLYDMAGGRYHYENGWNSAAVKAFVAAAVFSVLTVWVPWFSFLSGYNWIIGAVLGGALMHVFTRQPVRA